MTLKGILLAIFVFLLVRAARKLMTAGAPPPRTLPKKKRKRRALPSPLPAPVPMVDDEAAHAILGVAGDASSDEIRSAYQRLMREHHPDRAASRGRDEEARAEIEAKRLNRAYEALKNRDEND